MKTYSWPEQPYFKPICRSKLLQTWILMTPKKYWNSWNVQHNERMGGVVVLIVWWLDLQLPLQSVPITTNVESLNTATLCDKVFQWLAAGRWFSPGTPVSSTNKTDRHDITEILLKVTLNTITLTITLNEWDPNLMIQLLYYQDFNPF